MSDRWQVSLEPSPRYREWASDAGSLFHSEAWGAAVGALGARPTFAWNQLDNFGLMMSVFSRLGVKVGIIGFPQLCQPPWKDPMAFRLQVEAIARQARVQVVRANVGLTTTLESSAIAAKPELWIEDLSKWQSGSSKRRRRDLGFANRSGLRIEKRCVDPAECYRMYVDTLRIHGGRVRYTEAYFGALSALAEISERLQFRCGLAPDGRLLGFSVLAVDGHVAHYLHGAVGSEGRRLGLSDLLLDAIISEARARGSRQFTHMASPWTQPGLVAFKRKWSDAEGLTQTFDFGLGPVGKAVTLATRLGATRDRAAARRMRVS